MFYTDKRRLVHEPKITEKSDDFVRKCVLCNRTLLPNQKGDTIRIRDKLAIVHKKCKEKYLDKLIPKE